MPSNRAPAPRLPDAPKAYNQSEEQQFRAAVAKAILDSNQAQVAKPDIHVQASRTATSATLSITILDEDRRVTAIEFNKREGAGAATGWVSTWDTTSGTIGTDASLTRTEAISIPAGLDSSAEWRVKYRDQRGTERTEGGPIPLANLGSVTKTLRLPFTAFVPENDSTPWQYEQGYLQPNGTGTQRSYRAVAPLPSGVTVATVRARMYRNSSSDVGQLRAWSATGDGAITALGAGTALHSTTGWQNVTLSSLGFTVGTSALYLTTDLKSISTGADSRLSYAEVDYSTPSYDKTY